MEEFLTLGMLPFVGLCAGTGALAFFITRAVTPAKQCAGVANEYTDWSSQEGKYKHFQSGPRRIVHVSRGAIGLNMKNPETVYPSGVVIDEDGSKHEFHEIFTHGPCQLVFDRDGKTANVYLVTSKINPVNLTKNSFPIPTPRNKSWNRNSEPLKL